MSIRSWLVIVLSLAYAEGTCVFPGNFWSSSGIDSWYDSHQGTLNFTSTTLSGWQVWTIGAFTFTCDTADQTYYVLRSEEFTYLGLNLEAFLCLRMTEQSSNKYTYDTPTTQLSDAGNERIKIFLKDDKKVVSVITDFCDASNATDLTQHIMVKEGGIDGAKITCPSQLQMMWNYTYDSGSGNVCGDAYLDVCTDTNLMDFDYSKCTQTQAYSTTGHLYCLHSSTVGSYTHLYVYNTDTTTDESTTYRFTCYIMSSDGDNIYMSQNPKDCPPNGNSTYADSNGALVVLTSLSSCPTDPVSETYSATVEIVLGLLAFLIVIAIVIALVYYCYKRKKRLEAEAQKKREEEERQARIEREKKERMRMERAALTPTLDLGLPDDSVFDITRLFYEEEEPVTPTKVDTDLNERLIDRDTDRPFKNDDFMDEYKLRQMMDSEEWIDARKRKDVEEFEVAEPRTKSAIKRLKELAREKITKGKNKLMQKDPSTNEDEVKRTEIQEKPDVCAELGESDQDSDEYDFFSQAGWKKRKNTMNLDSEWESRKKKKRKKKKKKASSSYGDIKLNKIPLRRLSRRKRVEPDLPVVEGEIHLPLYRDDPKLKDLPPLQRVHRKRHQMLWSDMFGDIHGGNSLDLEAINRVRMSENKWKLLLEELYADKQYFDYARKSSAGRRVEKDINAASGQSLDYLYDRAKYWQDQPPVDSKSPKPEKGPTRNASPRRKHPHSPNDAN
uniref:Uncharacterized protein LOC111122961 isoform X1 n=1 Tax=Crassostrea virginica TaxID=6565 RepID=A0A8B8CYP5_CRAVI|nr:uncharacterized protein LOC111122961 isoform X1 [Crassostrea virginica]